MPSCARSWRHERPGRAESHDRSRSRVSEEASAVNPHALNILELPRVLDVVAGFATSSLGAANVRALTPTTDAGHLDREHARVAAMRAAAGGDDAWRPHPVPDLAGPLNRLRVEGAAWSGSDLVAGAILLRSSRLTQSELRYAR